MIPGPSRRGARARRVLVVAIFLVSSLQFLVPDPTRAPERAAAGHPLLGAPKRGENASDPRPPVDGGAASGTTLDGVRPGLEGGGGAAVVDPSGDAPNATVAVLPRKIVFCGSCSHDEKNTCNERLKYVMRRHKTPEATAREGLMPVCGIDYNHEPYVLLHAGPHKTGTTSIQSFLYNSLENNATYLQRDHFGIPTFDDLPGVFGGEGPMLNFAHCMINGFTKDGGQMNIAFCNRLRKTFPPFLEKTYNRSHNVLIVAEDLDRLTIDFGRMQYYLKPYRRFRVLVNYRRLHDWLPSWYNQIVDLYIQEYIQGKARYPSLLEWIDKEYDHFVKVHAMQSAERYRNSGKFESVRILNMHEEVPLLENLFCNHVLFSNATCTAIKEGAKPTKPNAGRTHDYERLATKAFLRGKLKTFHKAVSKDVVAKIRNAAIRQGIFKDENDYPIVCVNETFAERLLQTEMEMERTYFPGWYVRRGGDDALRRDFEGARHKLCTMDDEMLLASRVLDPVFEEIGK